MTVPYQYLDRVQDTSVTGGAGTLTLSGTAPSGWQNFSGLTTGVSNVPYLITQGSLWEVGIGTLASSTSISRDTVLAGSNGTSHVVFAASTAQVYCDLPANSIAAMAGANATVTTSVANTSTSYMVLIEGGVPKIITVDNLVAAIGSKLNALAAAGALSNTDEVAISQDGGNTLVMTTMSAIVAAGAAPTLTSAVVSDSQPTKVVCTFNKNLNTTAPAAGSFVTSGHVYTGISISGAVVTLTTSTPFVANESKTLAYTAPGTNNLQDTFNLQVVNFSGSAITDNVAPAVSSMQVQNGTPTVINVTFNAPIANVTMPAASAFTPSLHAATAVTYVDSTHINVTVAAAYINTDTITLAYTQPGSNPLKDVAGDLVDTFGATAVTNNVGGSTVPGAPTGVTGYSATPNGTTATIQFTAPSSNGGQTITGYTATAYISGVSTGITGSVSGAGSGTVQVTGLTVGNTYTFTVHATNSVGNSAESAATSAYTLFTVADHSGYSMKATFDASSVGTGNAPLKLVAYSSYGTTGSLYYDISGSPASATAGFGTSATIPAQFTSSNANGSSSQNGLIAMGHPGAWQALSNLWATIGEPSPTTFYHWVQPVGGLPMQIDSINITNA